MGDQVAASRVEGTFIQRTIAEYYDYYNPL